MYDIDTKNVKKGKNIWYIFIAIGTIIAITIIAIFIVIMNNFNSLDSQVFSKSVSINSYIDDEGSKMYTPIYTYEVDGENYTCGSTSSSFKPSEKNKVVHYDSKDPEKCMTDASKNSAYFALIFLIIPVVFITMGVVAINKNKKRVKQILELNNIGKLVKNLPYRLENTGTVVNGVPIQRPVVDYVLPNGNMVTLYGDPRNDRKLSDQDGMVDLVIDVNNPDNYFIDFEINRLSGNRDDDYYHPENNTQTDTFGFSEQTYN